MKKLLLMVTLCTPFSLNAQWEQIGWHGDKIAILGQLGSTLFGISSGLPVPFRPTPKTLRKSTDWGRTWSVFNRGLPITSISIPGFRSEFNSPQGLNTVGNSIFLYTTGPEYYPSIFEPGLFYTQEFDMKWSFMKLSPIEGKVPITDASSYIFFSTDSIFLRNGVSSALYFSSNGGITWERRMLGLPGYYNSVPILVKGSLFTVSSHSDSDVVYRSNSLGLKWEAISTPGSVHFKKSLWQVGDNILLLTKESQFSETVIIMYLTKDQGNTWEKISLPLLSDSSNANVFFIKTIDYRTFMSAVVGDKFYIFTSSDFGRQWEIHSAPNECCKITALYGKENQYILEQMRVLYEGHPFYHETDSFFQQYSPVVFSTSNLTDDKLLLHVDERTLYAASARTNSSFTSATDTFFISIDNGDQWSKYQIHDTFSIHSDMKWVESEGTYYTPAFNRNVYLGEYPRIYRPWCILRSKDKGYTWDRFITPPFMGNITSLVVKKDTFVIRTEYSEVGSSSHYDTTAYTTNNGLSWTIIQSPNKVTAPIVFPDLTIVGWGPSGERYSSYDLGSTWLPWKGPKVGAMGRLHNKWFNTEHYYNGTTNYIYTTSMTSNPDKYWSEVFVDSFSKVLTPSHFENGLMLGTLSRGESYGSQYDGRMALYASFDTGSTWKLVNDYVTSGKELFVGSEYYFLSGYGEIWRLKKSDLSSVSQSNLKISKASIISAYPNPGNSEINILFAPPKAGFMKLLVYDVKGRIISILKNGYTTQGFYKAIWDTQNIPTGSYVVELVMDEEKVTRRVQINK